MRYLSCFVFVYFAFISIISFQCYLVTAIFVFVLEPHDYVYQCVKLKQLE